MPVYKYVAINSQRQRVKGKFIAEDERDLAAALAKNNLYLQSARLYKEGTPSAFFTMGTGKVSMHDLTGFCRHIAIMITAGIPVPDCLESLKKQSYSGYFRSILAVVYDDVKGGAMLSEAFEKHKKVIPNFFRSMVHVGEASGRLDTVFVALADYYESDASIKRKARSALVYPMFLLAMTVGIVALMLAFIIPTFKDALADLDVEITGYTKVVYDLSDFLLEYGRYLILGVISVALIIFLVLRTERGKYFWDICKIRLPVIGKVSIDLLTARFSRAFSILLASGMDLSSAMDTVGMIIGNRYLSKRFVKAAETVKQGAALSDALRYYDIFPEMLLQMISVGERTATLDEVLSRTCSYFDEQVESSLASLTAKIQPIMLIFMGAIIGSLFLAVYSPMLSIMDTVSMVG